MPFALSIRTVKNFFQVFTTVCGLVSMCSVSANAATSWTKLSTPNIEIYTSDTPAAGAEVLRALEQSEFFFKTASGFEFSPDRPLKVLAFKSEEEYAPFRLNPSAFGHYLHGRNRDYIVLQDVRPEHLQATIHEYTHYVMSSAGFSLPIWLSEGLADFYSTVAVRGQKFIIGGTLPDRLMTLQRPSLLDLKTLFSADQRSAVLNDSDAVRVFYAESWALTHMLILSDGYENKFPEFLKTVSSGVSAVDAFRGIYGKDVNQVASDLNRYVARASFGAISRGLPVRDPDPIVRQAPVTAQESDLISAEVLAAHPFTAARARMVLANLHATDSRTCEEEELFGYLDWRDRQFESASKHFAAAIGMGSTDADLLYRYAELQVKAGISDGRVIDLLSQVVQTKPGNVEARFNLAVLEFNRGSYKAARETLIGLRIVKPEWNYGLYSMLAYCAMQDHQLHDAQLYGDQAKQFSRTPNEKADADRFLDYLGSVTTTPSGL